MVAIAAVDDDGVSASSVQHTVVGVVDCVGFESKIKYFIRSVT